MADISSGYFQNIDGLAAQSKSLYREKAKNLYEEATTAAKLRRFLARFCRCTRRMLRLSELTGEGNLVSSHYAGTKVVDIDQIVGSESRTEEFDDEFNPVQETTKERWLRIAQAFLRGETLPPVDLIQVDDLYFVRDGHHRVSVARRLGQHYIDAEITMLQIRKLVN